MLPHDALGAADSHTWGLGTDPARFKVTLP